MKKYGKRGSRRARRRLVMSAVSVAVLGYSPDPESGGGGGRAVVLFAPRRRRPQGRVERRKRSATFSRDSSHGTPLGPGARELHLRHRGDQPRLLPSIGATPRRLLFPAEPTVCEQDAVRRSCRPPSPPRRSLRPISRLPRANLGTRTRNRGGGVPAEDARYILPNACETKIVVSMNARELRHFFHCACAVAPNGKSGGCRSRCFVR